MKPAILEVVYTPGGQYMPWKFRCSCSEVSFAYKKETLDELHQCPYCRRLWKLEVIAKIEEIK